MSKIALLLSDWQKPKVTVNGKGRGTSFPIQELESGVGHIQQNAQVAQPQFKSINYLVLSLLTVNSHIHT